MIVNPHAWPNSVVLNTNQLCLSYIGQCPGLGNTCFTRPHCDRTFLPPCILLIETSFFLFVFLILKILFFLMWTIFKVFIEFVIISFLFYVLFFLALEACRILAAWPEFEPTLSALEGEVVTTGLPGRSPRNEFLIVQREWSLPKAMACPSLPLSLFQARVT